MNKNIALTSLLVISSVFLAGCTNPISQKIGENIVEKSIEAQTGAKVDINSNGDDVTIKTDEGQTQFSAGGNVKLPDGFPKELIVVDDAKLIVASSSDAGSTVSFLTNVDQTQVREKYISSLKSDGWKKSVETTTEKGSMLNFSKDKQNAVVLIGENDSKDQSGKIMVNITLVTEQD